MKAAHLPAIVIVVVLLGVRASQIVRLPIDDFDTHAFITASQDGIRPWPSFIDIAHPGLIGLVVWLNTQLVRHTGHAQAVWAAWIVGALALSVITLFACLRRAGAGFALSVALVVAYLASPVTADLAGRGEENLLFHAPFVYTLSRLHAHLEDGAQARAWQLPALGLALAALHLQPFMILMAGGIAWMGWRQMRGGIRGAGPTGDARRAALTLASFGAVPLLYLGLMFGVLKFPRPDYLGLYLSWAHNDSLPRYLKAMCLFAQGYLLTGRMPLRWTAVGVEPRGEIYLLGIVVLLALVALARRLRFLDGVLLAAVGFAVVYEPNSSERWDTVLLALLVRVGVGLAAASPRTARLASDG